MLLDVNRTWRLIQESLSKKKEFKLKSGSNFLAFFDFKTQEIVLIPLKTGIERRVNKSEWERFVKKYNTVVRDGYDPLKPGHYARITFNSSYLVVLVENCLLSKVIQQKINDTGGLI
jgi:hypothetical protein